MCRGLSARCPKARGVCFAFLSDGCGRVGHQQTMWISAMPRYPCPLLPHATSQKQGTRSRGCCLSKHVSAIDDLHAVTGHGQAPRPRHVFVRLCLVAEQTSLDAHEHPSPVGKTSGKLRLRSFHPERDDEAWLLTTTATAILRNRQQTARCVSIEV